MAQMNIRVDDEAEALAESDCSPDPFWSEENQARLRKSIARIEAGEGKVHEVNYDEDSIK